MPPEPTPAEVAAVNAHLGETPAAPVVEQPTPAVAQPAPVETPAPAPTGDPFESFAQPAPAAPVEPVAPVTPQPAPVEPVVQPAVAPAPAGVVTEGQYQSFDEYLDSITAGIPEPPATPKMESVDPNDPAQIQTFFDGLVKTAVDQATAEVARKTAVQTAESRAWEQAFTKFPSLKTNQAVRDMVHNIRMGSFRRGVAMTPTQAAMELLKITDTRYRAGVADNKVVTTTIDAQHVGGGSVEVIPQTSPSSLAAAAAEGEDALRVALEAKLNADAAQ